MNATQVTMHSKFTIAPVDPRVFGGFLEHMGRAVYEGVYDPGSSHADENGFRTDVLEALRGLGMTVMRYPGGNFASGYHWQDGVGPRDQRPTVRDLAWQSLETNRFGTEEFMRLCRKMNWEPMLTVNLGTGTPEEARNWVEYCNSSAGSRYADMRSVSGSREPHGVKLWCLGNEMDGPWQLGHVPADHYAIRARQAAKMMKDTDPTIEVVACGSCGPSMPTYMEWDRQVLDCLGEQADYISLHRYVGNPKDDTADYLAVTASVDRQIEEMDAVCRFVQAKRRSSRRAYLCFDEWNVWYRNMQMHGAGTVAPHLVEEVYNLEDALVVAGFLQSFIRHADAVRIANIAQIVNVIAPVLTRGDDILVQSIFYPFVMISNRRKGVALRLCVEGPTYESASNGRVAWIDASAILDDERLHMFLTNRSMREHADVRVVMADRAVASIDSAEILTGRDPKAANSFDAPDVIRTAPFENARVEGCLLRCTIPPMSFVAVTADLEA